MIKRYSRSEMAAIWQPENKYKVWLDIELLALEAWNKLGKVPLFALKKITEKASFSVKRIEEIEKEVHHDVIAFLTNVAENVGEGSNYLHYGLTSSDVVDTANAFLMKQAAWHIIKEAKELGEVLKEKANKYKDTIMPGRTHGIQAEPTSFGLKLLVFYFEIKRSIKRLEEVLEVISYGKLSGAVGTYANTEPEVEKYVMDKLGLKTAKASTQIIQRDRHAQFMSVLAILASSLDKFATEIRHLQRTEVNEVAEPFSEKQKGSSAMPHKKNPIISERISGLARVVRGNLQAALENVALWHERDISHSSVERIILPDTTILVDYMLAKFREIIKNIVVNEEQMKLNLEISGGRIFSQRLLLALVEKGLRREKAYRIIQKNALKSGKDSGTFKNYILEDTEVGAYLAAEEVEKLFDYRYYLRRINKIFERVDTT